MAVGRAGIRQGVTGVLAADDQGLEAAVDHLASLGHQRIAFVDGPRGSIARAAPPGLPRRVGAAGCRAARRRPARWPHRGRGGRAAERLLFRPARDRPTAVVAFNDRVAIGLRDAVLRAGSVPEDVSVVGYDDSPLARLATIDLTSVSQEPEALADATVAVVATLLEGGPGERVADIVIPPRLVVRTSTGPPARRE